MPALVGYTSVAASIFLCGKGLFRKCTLDPGCVYVADWHTQASNFNIDNKTELDRTA